MNSASRGSGSGVSPATAGTLSSTPSPAVVESGAGNRYADASGSARLTPPPPPPHAAGLESGAPTTQGHHPSHGNDERQSSHPGGGDGLAEDAKRSRACEACRGLKVRCEMADEGPCRRCRKAGRRCVVTVRSRGGERQKKTDTRVADLERKIDALAATLQARGGSEHASGSPGGVQQRERTGGDAAAAMPESTNAIASTLLTDWGVTESPAPTPAGQQPPVGQKRKRTEAVHDPRTGGEVSRPPNLRNSSPGADGADIVGRGLMTMERAEELFSRYNELMVPHFPVVVFPPGSTAAKLREDKPVLFLAIMAAASSDTAALQKVLVKELMQTFGERVIVTGEKSLALVQALYVSVAWYWPPEAFEELKFYQLAHIAIVMSIDLGLGRSPGKTHRPATGWSGFGGTRTSRVDSESLECRRTWLAGYALSTNMSIGLRRANLVPWANFMGESLELLETSPDAAPTDKYLCQLVRANRIGEETTTQFSIDDPVMSVNLADVRTQVTLKMLERELEKLKRDTPQELQQPTLEFGWGTIDIYMHEMALHSDDFDNMRGCFPITRLDDGLANMNLLTTFHLDAIVACFSAVTGVFDTFIAMDINSLRVLPVFNFVRVAYAVVVLIKIYFTAAAPDTEIGKVLPKESIRVEHYVDSVLQKFMAAAAEDRCRPAAKFLIVLVMLRGWLNNKTGGDKDKRAAGSSSDNRSDPAESSPDNRSGAGGRPRTSRTDPTAGSSNLPATPGPSMRCPGMPLPSGQVHQPQGMMGYPPASTANTPLQLLSEVAAGDSSMAGRTSHLGWQNRPSVSGPSPQPFTFSPNTAAGLAPMDVMAGPAGAGMQWPGEAAQGMGVYLLGDNVDWEGMALNFGVGMSAEHEYEIMNMMTELNKPWVGGQGMTAEPGGMPAGQGVYYQQ